MSEQKITPNPALTTRRVVTGHNQAGRSCIASDTAAPVSTAILHADFVVNDIWRSDALPADNLAQGEPVSEVDLEPSAQGNVIRIVQFPPDKVYLGQMDVEKAFQALGKSGTASSTHQAGTPHPLMHQTRTVDYIVVISGEIYAVMEEGETRLCQGDVLIQRGTNHAWSNRSDRPCVIAAVLNAAKPLADAQ